MIDLHKETELDSTIIRIPVTEAEAGTMLFEDGPVYCAPARGHWTIAHTPMLIPGCYMIYLCASACMRGVVLSALEYGGMDRFSMILLDDRDIYEGNLEQMMIDGICEIIDGCDPHPPLVMPFTSCIHHFLACDQNYIYNVLREKYPDIDFVRGYMIPTIRRGFITPEEQIWITMCEAWREEEKEPKSVNIIGSNFAADHENDYYKMLLEAGWTVRDLPEMNTYQEYLNMGKSSANIYCYPVAAKAAARLERRLGQTPVGLTAGYDFAQIRQDLTSFAEKFQLPLPDLDAMQAEAEEALQRAYSIIGCTPIAIDHEAVPLVCSLAKTLIAHGFRVTEIYTDQILSADISNLEWLKQNAPDLDICATENYACRMADRDAAQRCGGNLLAIGQKAAYFTGTRHFVNLLENGGLWGFNGVCGLADRMIEAYRHESDTEAVISVKGWGCHA